MKDNLCVNTIRALGLAMIDDANSGHPGIVLGAAPIIYTVYAKHLVANPGDTRWINRDRFIMAAGHGSALYYAMLHVAGYDITIDDLKNFRKLNSKTPGHPEFQHTPGVDATSGPLGQGVAMGVGTAIAEEFLRSKYNVTNHYTYVLCGDGDLQEGVTQEAMSLAGVQKLSNLIVMYDSNDIQLDTPVNIVNREDTRNKYEAMNWNYILVENGNSVDQINEAIEAAKMCKEKPSIIEVKTKIGFGSKHEGECAAHGAPLGHEESKKTMSSLDYNYDNYTVDKQVYSALKNSFGKRGMEKYKEFENTIQTIMNEKPDLFKEMYRVISHSYDTDYNAIYEKLKTDKPVATRVSGGKVLEEISKTHMHLLAGTADLSCSTKVMGSDGDFSPSNRKGRNINYGVREHAMAAISNGIVLHSGLDAVASGFFVFSDYMKPSIRMSALMNVPTIYTFTHDSIAVGEDGPTHQPIEQLVTLRSTPNLDVFRPASLKEVIASYKIALNKQNPTAIILTRQNLPNLDNVTSIEEASKGAYIVKDFDKIDGIILASGSELALALEVSEKLEDVDLKYRVISVLSMELFDLQPEEYINKLLPKNVRRRFAIELSTKNNWYKYIGLDGKAFGIDAFGYSAKAEDVFEFLKYDAENIFYEISKLSVEEINKC